MSAGTDGSTPERERARAAAVRAGRPRAGSTQAWAAAAAVALAAAALAFTARRPAASSESPEAAAASAAAVPPGQSLLLARYPAPGQGVSEAAGADLGEWEMAVPCPEGNSAGFCLRPSLFAAHEVPSGDEVVFVQVSNAPWLLVDGLEDVIVDGMPTRVPARMTGGGQPGFRAVVRVPGRAAAHQVTFATRYKAAGRAEVVTRTTARYDGRAITWHAESALDAVDVLPTGGRVYKVADWRR